MTNKTPELKLLPSGTKHWHLNGELHREDGPAVVHSDGHEEWWLHGKRHRVGGPAIIGRFGGKQWYLNGRLHREDGPAFEIGGLKQWWLDNHKVCDNAALLDNKGDYIVLERGIPTDVMFGKLRVTQAKLLTAEGTMLVWDNLPGMKIEP